MTPIQILLTDSRLLSQIELVEQIAKLEKQGHTVTVDDSLAKYDVVAGPNCWLLRPEVCGLFQLAVTNARRIANADQDRAKQSAAKAAPKRKPRAASQAHSRVNPVTTTGPTGASGDDTPSDGC